MNKKLRCFLILIVVSLLIVSCVEGEATETPATEITRTFYPKC